jgi:alpha-galactosidase
VVGLCHGLFANLHFIRDLKGLQSEDDIAAKYGGLNHFFWITELRVKGLDMLAELRRQLQTKGLGDLIPNPPNVMHYQKTHDLANELFHLTGGVMPYLGDRHTSEFFSSYITSHENMKKYKLVRTTIQQRQDGMDNRIKGLRDIVEDRVSIPEAYLSRSRETAADIINAHYLGKSFIDVGNLPNRGQISNLSSGLAVETAMRVDANGFSPITFGPLPPVVLGMVEPSARTFEMTVEACLSQNREMALQALRLDPVCAHLTANEVREMGESLLAAHQSYIPRGLHS